MRLSLPKAKGALRRRWKGALVLVSLTGTIPFVFACGTSANEVGYCDTVATALCNRAAYLNCNGTWNTIPDGGADGGNSINLTLPPHVGDTEADNAAACMQWYMGSACLHGLANTSTMVSTSMVSACVGSIQSATCQEVANPQIISGCSWLNPPDAAAPDAVAETSTDAKADMDAGSVVFDVKLDT